MQHKSFLILSIFLSFFSALPQDKVERPVDYNTPEPTTRLRSPHKKFKEEISTPEPEIIQHIFIAPNQDNSTAQEAASCIGKVERLTEEDVIKFIEDSPPRLNFFIQTLKDRVSAGQDLYQKDCYDKPPFVTLVGPPGTGKSSLAIAIAQHCSLHPTFLKATTLADRYQNSAESNLNEIFNSIENSKGPQAIILDEMHKIIKQDKPNDNNAAAVLWQLLDGVNRSKNILFIATANDITGLPEQLRQRLTGRIYIFKTPNLDYRIKTMRYHLNKLKPLIPISLSKRDINYLARETNGFTNRDFELAFTEIIEYMNFLSKEKPDSPLKLTKDIYLQAIIYVKNNNGIYKSLPAKIYDYIKPAIAPALQIGIPLTINLLFNYWMQHQAAQAQQNMHLTNLSHNALLHQESLVQAKEFHLAGLAQAQRLHDEGLLQTKQQHNESMQQARFFHDEQKIDNTINMICSMGINTALHISIVNPAAAAIIGGLSFGLKLRCEASDIVKKVMCYTQLPSKQL